MFLDMVWTFFLVLGCGTRTQSLSTSFIYPCVLSFLCNVEHFSTRNEFILFDVLSFVIPFKGWDLFNCKVLY